MLISLPKVVVSVGDPKVGIGNGKTTRGPAVLGVMGLTLLSVNVGEEEDDDSEFVTDRDCVRACLV